MPKIKVNTKANAKANRESRMPAREAAPAAQQAGKARAKARSRDPAAPVAPVAPEPASSPPHSTKQARILELLARESGARLDELVSATGWLPHTTRATLTRLRQNGHTLIKSKDEEGRTLYRIEVARPAPRSGKAA